MFSIGTLQNVQHDLRKVQVLVVAPTRELASQIHQVSLYTRINFLFGEIPQHSRSAFVSTVNEKRP